MDLGGTGNSSSLRRGACGAGDGGLGEIGVDIFPGGVHVGGVKGLYQIILAFLAIASDQVVTHLKHIGMGSRACNAVRPPIHQDMV